MKVVVLSGGVGGARFLRGVVSVVDPADVTVIGNVGDDVEVLGLHVSPDLDSVLYALAGVADEERGWGRADETWNALETAGELGGEAWFRLGDRDIGLHLVRTQALRAGRVALGGDGAARARVRARVRAAARDRRPAAHVPRDARRAPSRSRPGSSRAATATRSTPCTTPARPRRAAAPGVVEALDAADVIVIAPSNPYVSIGPILAVEEIRAALERRRVPCVAVSPLDRRPRGQGPGRPDARAARRRDVAGARRRLLRGPDRRARARRGRRAGGAADGVRAVVTRTLMSDADARRRLAQDVLDAAGAPA